MAIRSANEVLSGLRAKVVLNPAEQAALTAIRSHLDSQFAGYADAAMKQAVGKQVAELFNKAFAEGPQGQVGITFSLGSANLTPSVTAFAAEEIKSRCAAAGLQASSVEPDGKNGRVTVRASYDLGNINLGKWSDIGLTLLGDGADELVDAALGERQCAEMSSAFAEQVSATQATLEKTMWRDIGEGGMVPFPATATLSTGAIKIDSSSPEALGTLFDSLYKLKLALESGGYGDVQAVQENQTIKLTTTLDLAAVKKAMSEVANQAYEKNKAVKDPVPEPVLRESQFGVGYGYTGWSSPRPESSREPAAGAIARLRTR